MKKLKKKKNNIAMLLITEKMIRNTIRSKKDKE